MAIGIKKNLFLCFDNQINSDSPEDNVGNPHTDQWRHDLPGGKNDRKAGEEDKNRAQQNADGQV